VIITPRADFLRKRHFNVTPARVIHIGIHIGVSEAWVLRQIEGRGETLALQHQSSAAQRRSNLSEMKSLA